MHRASRRPRALELLLFAACTGRAAAIVHLNMGAVVRGDWNASTTARQCTGALISRVLNAHVPSRSRDARWRVQDTQSPRDAMSWLLCSPLQLQATEAALDRWADRLVRRTLLQRTNAVAACGMPARVRIQSQHVDSSNTLRRLCAGAQLVR